MNQPLKPRSFFTVSLSVLLATFATALGAQSVEAAKPMALRTIMERLGRDMQAVTGAISKEDWPLVAELAPRIAKHAEPPMSEKMRALIEFALGEGWRVVRTSGGHLEFTKQGCASIYTSSTASDHRADRNARAQLRRADRQAQENGRG